jgi:hypothetical protein
MLIKTCLIETCSKVQTDGHFLDLKLSPCWNVISFLLCDSPASEFYVRTFWNTLFNLHRLCKKDEDETDRVFRNIGT